MITVNKDTVVSKEPGSVHELLGRFRVLRSPRPMPRSRMRLTSAPARATTTERNRRASVASVARSETSPRIIHPISVDPRT